MRIGKIDLVLFDESTLGTLSVCFPAKEKDYADDVAVNLSSMGEKNQHQAPDADAAQISTPTICHLSHHSMMRK
jgi:hypothetical protein